MLIDQIELLVITANNERIIKIPNNLTQVESFLIEDFLSDIPSLFERIRFFFLLLRVVIPD